MKYTIGDEVILRKDLIVGNSYGGKIYNACLSAESYKPFTIVDIWDGDHYEAKVSGSSNVSYFITDAMIDNFYYVEVIDLFTLLTLIYKSELKEGIRFIIEGYLNPLVYKDGLINYEDDYVEESFIISEDELNKAVYILPPKTKQKENKESISTLKKINITQFMETFNPTVSSSVRGNIIELAEKINEVIDFISQDKKGE